MEYKNFLPKIYTKRKCEEIKKRNKRIFYMIGMYNLLILPINFSYLTTKEEVAIIQEVVISNDSINREDIFKWLEIENGNYITLKVSDGIGDIKVESKVNLYNIESLGFDIKEVKKAEEVYEIRVE